MHAIVYEVSPLGWAMCRLLGGLRPSLRTSGLAGVRLADVPPPSLPGDDWVRVRTLLGGICGTDIALLAQKQPPNSILQAFSSQPLLLGHENVAVVEEVGPAVSGEWKGRRVCVEPTLACAQRGIEPRCRPCQAGEFGACENFGSAGAGRYRLPAGTSIGYNAATGGSHGEGFVAHESQLVPVPDTLTDEQAVLTDPLACSLHAVLRADLGRADNVLVYGSGMLGLGVVDALRAVGFKGAIRVVSRHDYLGRLAAARGATEVLRLPPEAHARFEKIAQCTGGRAYRVRFGNLGLSGGFDVVFDCVGSRQSIQESFKWARNRGQVVLVGTGHGGQMDLTPLWFGELTVIGAYGRQVERIGGALAGTEGGEVRQVGTYPLVHELIARGLLRTEGLLTHTFRLEQYREAFELSMAKSGRQAVRAAFDLRG